MALSLLKKVVGEWSQVRDFIFKDLQKIEKALNNIPPVPTYLPPRVDSVFSSPTPGINTDTTDFFYINQLEEDILSFSMNLSGEPLEGQHLTIRFLDNNTPHVVSWGSSFASRGATLPTTTTAGKYTYVFLIYNTITSTFDCFNTVTEA